MKAVRYHRPKKVSVDDVPEPRVQHPRDAVIRITSTAICGSDLHIYNGLAPQLSNMTLGHEFMGIVEHVGAQVDNLDEGDRVVVPFPVSCGQCWFCTHELPTACENSNPHYGPGGKLVSEKGGGLFGYTDLYGGKEGGQAEKVRVPYADHGPRRVPDDMTDEQALFLTDILPTAWHGVEWGGVQEDDTVAVFGCGPVGILAQRIAKMRGADVIGVEPLDYRRDMTRQLVGSTVLDPNEENVVEAIRDQTDGRGADVVIDAVGMEADRGFIEKASAVVHLQRGTMKVIRTCYDAVRRGGKVSVLGVYVSPYDNYPMHQFFDKALQVKGGQANVHNVIDDLLGMVQRDELHADDIITHVAKLEEAPAMYEIFNEKEDGCMKVVLKP